MTTERNHLYTFGGILIYLCCFLSFHTTAQNFLKPIGSSTSSEHGSAICKATNGDYFIGGYQDNAALIVRVAPDGTVVWSKTYEFSQHTEQIRQIICTSNNTIVAAGSLYSGGVQGSFVFSIAFDGTELWNKDFSINSPYNALKGVSEAGNGNLRANAFYHANSHLEPAILELDVNTGNMLWDSIYVRNNSGNALDESLMHIKTNPLNGASYACSRLQTDLGNQSYRCGLLKLGINGDYEWNKNYFYPVQTTGGRFYSYGVDFDNDSVVVNISGQNQGNTAPYDFGFFKTDVDGNLAWSKYYYSNTNYDLRVYHIITTPNGYVHSGWTSINGNDELVLVSTNKQGTILWAKAYGTTMDETTGPGAMTERLLLDGNSIVTVGSSLGFGGNSNIALLKVDLITGIPDNGLCHTDLQLTEEVLPNFQMDYELTPIDTPYSQSDATSTITNVNFNEGALVENVTDTIVSNDTLYSCTPIDIRADWDASLSYLWNTGSTNQIETINTSGIYWVEVTANGCTFITDTVHVVIGIALLDLGADTTLCDNETLLLDATGTNTASYVWQDNSTAPTYLVNSAGTYHVEVDDNGCVARDTIVVNYGTLPVIDLGADTLLCGDATLVLDASGTGATFEWQDGSQAPSYDVASPGLYSVTVSNGGCSATDSINVTYTAAPAISLNDTSICENNTFFYFVNITNGTYLWHDGSTDPYYLVQGPGVYSVDVSNQCGTTSLSATVDAKFCFCDIYAPNTFTPDGDERNNTFGIVSPCPLYKFEMLIFNRWGEVVFETTDINEGWDATYKGKNVQDGMYTWKITYDYADQKDDPQKLSGHVTVLH